MMATKGQPGTASRAAIVASVLLLLPSVAAAMTQETLSNGLRLRIHSPDEILIDTALMANAPGGPYALAGDPSAWYPFSVQTVRDAMAQMHGFQADIAVEVFILPVPVAGGGRSWSTQDAIFLVPGFGMVPGQTQAYIATHEIGHVLTWARMDAHPARWQAYLAARGLDGSRAQEDQTHAWRPREILAEDLRYLFGGSAATASGSIENHDLPTPDRIDGLREMLSVYLSERAMEPWESRSCAYPNPCNPRTTLRMILPEGVRSNGAEVRIYDVRGSLVRRLMGGSSAPGMAEMVWDGKDNGGEGVASGRYLYVMKSAGHTARGAVTLVR